MSRKVDELLRARVFRGECPCYDEKRGTTTCCAADYGEPQMVLGRTVWRDLRMSGRSTGAVCKSVGLMLQWLALVIIMSATVLGDASRRAMMGQRAVSGRFTRCGASIRPLALWRVTKRQR